MLKYHVAVCDDEKSDLDGLVSCFSATGELEPTNSRYILFVPDFCFSWR